MCECSKNDPTMFFAMLAAAGLLAVWMICRGLKMKTNNAVILIAVVVLVAGVAWFRSSRSAPDATGTEVAAQADNPQGPGASAPVQPGELPLEQAHQAEENPSGPATAAPDIARLPRAVDLGADKCIPCKQMAPILAELRKEYEGRAVVEFIDVWKNPGAGELYGIRIIPTQIFFDAAGKEVWRHEGFLPKADFVAKFAEMGVK